MRHPLPLAKELATLQNLSGGRLILGAGVGWLEAEFDALGVPFRERGRRMDEGIAMMRAVWSDDPVSVPGPVRSRRSSTRCACCRSRKSRSRSGSAARRSRRSSGRCGSTAGTARARTPEQAAPIVERLRGERPDAGFRDLAAHGWDGKR